ncbi:hypothetical protein B005_2793 [Nocardiopsis alba ATCC BAA-2165]|uniref:Uncharacterized protein n=1 Tax=Nocardiopsis alba (strain ATCC BAA-2165 / BE74) TaxID=1205910 RepID=J7L5N4_NOCAA|nr:hypothetical protein B005_2793 [Nocardiopsis alba ATCC BAA-2165]
MLHHVARGLEQGESPIQSGFEFGSRPGERVGPGRDSRRDAGRCPERYRFSPNTRPIRQGRPHL